MTIKILLADDQSLMLEGIKAILKQQPEIEVVGTARDGQTAIAQVEKLQPDIILIDIEMPKMNGIVATEYICKYLSNTRVIVLTGHKNKSYLTQALQAGASGYLFKDSLRENLQQAIYSLSQGCFYIEAKLLSPPTSIRGGKTIKRRPDITYFKKYQKNIYTPSNSNQYSDGAHKSQARDSEFSKISVSPVCSSKRASQRTPNAYPSAAESAPHESYVAEEIDIAEAQILTTAPPSRARLRRYCKRIVWLLIAIASLILSIIIF